MAVAVALAVAVAVAVAVCVIAVAVAVAVASVLPKNPSTWKSRRPVGRRTGSAAFFDRAMDGESENPLGLCVGR